MSVLILQRTGDKGSNRAEEHVVDAEGCMGHAGITHLHSHASYL